MLPVDLHEKFDQNAIENDLMGANGRLCWGMLSNMIKHVPPALDLQSFSCPHCGAHASQAWLQLNTIDRSGLNARVNANARVNLASNEPMILTVGSGQHSLKYFHNLNVTECFSCKRMAVWVADKIVWPATSSIVIPHEDMPMDVRSDFLEAASIVDTSPRGAAALLRLAVERLMPYLDAKGKNINASIGALVAKGLDPKIQKALDVLRVIGNEAVHPGQIDLKDDKAAALKLFDLVNLIVQTLITTPNQINSMFESLPPNALDGIQKRDGGGAKN